ncbi:MAG: phosphate signaling complex protein PhoU [Rhizobiales bacterium]|nr:phosphate signaling complex protein PhoU [Hyphomicrobiales bacterium]
MSEHIVTAFAEELSILGSKIAQMGGLAEKQLIQATDALASLNVDLAREVIELDQQLDDLEREVEEHAILLIARRQPVALDLREVMAAIRLSTDLERIGDLAKNIAKRVIAIEGARPRKRLIHGIERMSLLAMEQLKRVLDSYSRMDVAGAIEVWHRDEEIDAMYTSLFRELLTYMMEDPRAITPCTHLLFAAKNIERIGDHATNMAETVHYLVNGEPIGDERPKGDESSFTSIDHLNPAK